MLVNKRGTKTIEAILRSVHFLRDFLARSRWCCLPILSGLENVWLANSEENNKWRTSLVSFPLPSHIPASSFPRARVFRRQETTSFSHFRPVLNFRRELATWLIFSVTFVISRFQEQQQNCLKPCSLKNVIKRPEAIERRRNSFRQKTQAR